jgi:hypothetical protein
LPSGDWQPEIMPPIEIARNHRPDCWDGPLGLIITTGAPVTQVKISGAACSKSRFHCIPADLDNTIQGECQKLQVVATTSGTCTVDLTVGGADVRVKRQMVRSTCDCYGEYFTEANREGEIDLRTSNDGGVRE